MMVKKYVTDITNKIFFNESETELVDDDNEENNIINVHTDVTKQKWLGLGGALTGSTVYNYNKLDSKKKDEFLSGYFKELNYNFLRLPIGSTDFSPKAEESYLDSFDENVKIIKKIKDLKKFQILATPWSPPERFKDNSSLFGGKLKRECYNEYASYLIDCIKDYKFADIKIDYLSIQNEPNVSQKWESCEFEISELKDFMEIYLIPKLKKTKIILWDHNKDNLYNVFNELYDGNSALAGLGFHWYTGGFYDEMKLVNEKFPFALLFETEMCCGFSKYNRKEWIKDAELYINEIIRGINSGLNVFFDWNMLLDYKGGPNHKHNNCKSPIIMNKKNDDFIRTPIFYYLKHIGMANKAKVLATSCYDRNADLNVVALKNEKTYITVVNQSEHTKKINIRIGKKMIKDSMNKHSVVSFVID